MGRLQKVTKFSKCNMNNDDLYRFLENKTADLTACKQMGYFFINCKEDHYRLFGYHCIRKVCKEWAQLNANDKNELKKLSITLFEFKITDNCQNLTLLKEKISELIVMLATESWPHEWSELLPSLYNLAQKNPISLQILFIILKD